MTVFPVAKYTIETPHGYLSHGLNNDGLAHFGLAGDSFDVGDWYLDDVVHPCSAKSIQHFGEECVSATRSGGDRASAEDIDSVGPESRCAVPHSGIEHDGGVPVTPA